MLRSLFRARLFGLLLLVSGAAAAQGGAPIRLDLSFPNRAHHEMEVTVTFSDVTQDPLEIRMSRSSPGRYALHEFAKNVYSVSVFGRDGRELAVERPDPHQWNVSGHGGEVRFRYTLFGDRADGTYSAIDRTHAHLNAPASFAWARGLEDRPWSVHIDAPSEWPNVATQLPRAGTDPYVRTAPDLDYLLDSPIEVSAFQWYWWEVDERGRPQTDVRRTAPPKPSERQQIRIALHHEGSEADAEPYVEATRRIVEELGAVFGELPDFDYGSYVFLADYLPWANGDGMEHRNSTVLTSSSSLRTNRTGLLGTVAHEFVHAWSIERLRPASLEPFDFERANMSGELWFGEGFTSYYDDVILARAGVLDLEQMTQRFGGLISYIVNSPARQYRSPIEMSRRAPFVDAATWLDPTNDGNTFISYYSYGAFLGLALDLMIRDRFPGTSLDDVMRLAWERKGRSEVPYTNDDLESFLAEAIGDPSWARDFFDRYVRGSDVPPLEKPLEAVGLVLSSRYPGRATWGQASLGFENGALRIRQAVPKDSPLYEAGLSRRDRIVEVDGEKVPRSGAKLRELLDGKKPGDTVELTVEGRGTTTRATVVLVEDTTLQLTTFAAAQRSTGTQAKAERRDWLGAGAKR